MGTFSLQSVRGASATKRALTPRPHPGSSGSSELRPSRRNEGMRNQIPRQKYVEINFQLLRDIEATLLT